MPLSKEEAARCGYEIKPIKHNMNRRAEWNDYFMPGRYGVTVHLWSDEEGRINPVTKLSDIVGTCKERNVEVALTDLGRLVQVKIDGIGTHKYEDGVKVIHSVIMPTHIHLTIEITKMLRIVPRKDKEERHNLGHIIGDFKAGCTGWFMRLMKGESADHILTFPNWRDLHNPDGSLKEGVLEGSSYLLTSEGSIDSNEATASNTPTDVTIPPSLWEPNFNDKILNTTRKVEEWIYYEDMNPWFWRLHDENPQLMQRRLHIDIAMKSDGDVVDFSAFGCIFLLRKGERIQVQCTRLAEKGMLTEEEWRFFSQPEQARKYEAERETHSLGYWDRRWLYNTDVKCKTPIPYELTAHFRKYKEGILSQVRAGVIPVSPAVSKGEQEIFYTAADEGFPVIKLSKTLFTARKHPVRRDRILCSKGLMLVLGPWELACEDYYSREGNLIDKSSDRAIFNDLNTLAARMCDAIGSMTLKEQLEVVDLEETSPQ